MSDFSFKALSAHLHILIILFNFNFIYLAAPGLNCSTQDLHCHVRVLSCSMQDLVP